MQHFDEMVCVAFSEERDKVNIEEVCEFINRLIISYLNYLLPFVCEFINRLIISYLNYVLPFVCKLYTFVKNIYMLSIKDKTNISDFVEYILQERPIRPN